MLTRLIKEETLRTYLFTYSHVYESISMPKLADMFQLKRPIVHSIISKMIINEELMVLYLYFYIYIYIYIYIYTHIDIIYQNNSAMPLYLFFLGIIG